MTTAHDVQDITPRTDLATVFTAYENDAYADPSRAWRDFTDRWNWAAPLPCAYPTQTTVARPVSGGFSISGQWQVPVYSADIQWLALQCVTLQPVVGEPGYPAILVVASKALPCSREHHCPPEGAAVPTTLLQVDKLHVPAGLTTSPSGTPLRNNDAPFLWTSVTGMALGAARRLTESLATLHACQAASTFDPVAVSPATAAAELATLLNEARWDFTSRLPGADSRVAEDATTTGELLKAQVRTTCRLAHHVVWSAYEHALACTESKIPHPLESLIRDSTAILQHVRFTGDLLPSEGRVHRLEGDTTCP